MEGTCDFIDDQKAKTFVQQLDDIRIKFGAELGTVSISTHFRDSSIMKDVLEIGQIVNTRGLRGEVKVNSFTDDNTKFERIPNVFLKLSLIQASK